MSAPGEVDLGDLALTEGAHLVVRRALREGAGRARVTGASETLAVDLPAWCRQRGLRVARDGAAWLVESDAVRADPSMSARLATNPRWAFASKHGHADGSVEGAVADAASPTWGLAARGAFVEEGGPRFDFRITDKREVWAEDVGRLYALAAANQWDPATAIPWDAPIDHPEDVELAVVQVMTYLIENETAALQVPARFLGQVHPYFREVVQFLATVVADEARHIEVFTRRATLVTGELGLSTVGGQASLATLFDEREFAIASFLLSVLGEGSFLSLLWFLHRHAPDPVTRALSKLAAQDEARHVAFGLSHLTRHLTEEPDLAARLAAAVRRRHASLATTAGLNEEVFDALTLLAAGSFAPADLRRGHAAVVDLAREMDEGRRQRLVKLGFDAAEAAALSSLHTRNFM